MRHACLRPKVLEVSDPKPITISASAGTGGAPADVAVAHPEEPLLIPPILDLPDGNNSKRKQHESLSSDDESPLAVKHTDAVVVVPTDTTTVPLGVSHTAAGSGKRGSRKTRKSSPLLAILCCFAPSSAVK
jgi:hypothetical protein